jgi:hypothetical protein
VVRPRRRGLASINAEVRDGIVPAAEGLALTPSPPPSTDAGVQRNYRTIALIIACALFMEQMDATILATALPTMARDFGVPVTWLSSALTSYLMALAVFIPASGGWPTGSAPRRCFVWPSSCSWSARCCAARPATCPS